MDRRSRADVKLYRLDFVRLNLEIVDVRAVSRYAAPRGARGALRAHPARSAAQCVTRGAQAFAPTPADAGSGAQARSRVAPQSRVPALVCVGRGHPCPRGKAARSRPKAEGRSPFFVQGRFIKKADAAIWLRPFAAAASPWTKKGERPAQKAQAAEPPRKSPVR